MVWLLKWCCLVCWNWWWCYSWLYSFCCWYDCIGCWYWVWRSCWILWYWIGRLNRLFVYWYYDWCGWNWLVWCRCCCYRLVCWGFGWICWGWWCLLVGSLLDCLLCFLVCCCWVGWNFFIVVSCLRLWCVWCYWWWSLLKDWVGCMLFCFGWSVCCCGCCWYWVWRSLGGLLLGKWCWLVVGWLKGRMCYWVGWWWCVVWWFCSVLGFGFLCCCWICGWRLFEVWLFCCFVDWCWFSCNNLSGWILVGSYFG